MKENDMKTFDQNIWDSPSNYLKWWFAQDRLTGEEKNVFDSYYRSYKNNFNEYMSHCYNRRLREIMGILSSCPGKMKLLEIGSGTGSEILFLSRLCKRAVGIESYIGKLRCANQRKQVLEKHFDIKLPVEFIHSLVQFMPEDEKFDIIWMEEAFHHIEPRKMLVEKIVKLLAPEGVIIISETNGLNPLVQAKLIARRGFKTIIKQKHPVTGETYLYGNERILAGKKMKQLFESAGLETEFINHFRILPNIESALFYKQIILLENYFSKLSILRPLFVCYNYGARKV